MLGGGADWSAPHPPDGRMDGHTHHERKWMEHITEAGHGGVILGGGG